MEVAAEFDADWRRRFRERLRRWHARAGRELPWRNSRDPYRVWISEIMLQQTTVAAVVPYFERFLTRFPDVATLAAADEQEVLQLWEGLGYYSRARNIHKTARTIVAELAGAFPESVRELEKLPGIGRYTAGAIVSFAYDRPAPIVEANTLRLYSRLLGYIGDPRSSEGQRLLWSFAESNLPRKNSAAFNQAFMDLGATLCTPADPGCDRCPVKACCRAFEAGKQSEIPVAQNRPAVTELTEAAVAIEHDGRYLLCRRPHGERWAGLWDFPRYATVPYQPQRNGRNLKNIRIELEHNLAQQLGLKAEVGDLLKQLRHSVTRYRIQLLCFESRLAGKKTTPRTEESAWVAPKQFQDYPLSVTGRKFADLLVNKRDELPFND